VLVLTARDATSDRIAGLDAGADDYLVKRSTSPNSRPGCARCCGAVSTARSPPRVPRITLDPGSQSVTWNGQPVSLQRKELILLRELIAQPGAC